MNIIRTRAVELTTIPAMAYKQKLASGGAGLKLLRIDDNQSAVCTIDRRTGDLLPYGKVDETLFPEEAFEEAYDLTRGLPYSARGNIKVTSVAIEQEDDAVEETATENVDMTLSAEYQAIVERYSDQNGKMNYQLMNKDFIQYASKSKIVANLVESNASQEQILVCIVKSRATEISNQKESLDDISVKLLIETLDEINPRSAFKELKAHINRMLSKSKDKKK